MIYWLHRNATALLIYACFVVAELHHLWANDTSVQNWILVKYTPMPVQWNVKYASDQLVCIMIALAMFCYGQTPSKSNGKAVLVYLLWVIFDTLVYFYNYKSFLYWQMYPCLLFVMAFVYGWEYIKKYLRLTLNRDTCERK
jgi:hypothetical protein